MVQKVGGVEFDVDVDASGVAAGSKNIQTDLAQVETAFQQVDASADKASKGLTKSANTGAKSFRNMRGALGNLGFQAQDIAVQLQAGTDAMIVFTQQGSQIAGAFGPTGAIVGGIIAVAGAITSALIPALKSAEGELKTLPENIQKRLDEIKKAYSEIGESTKTAFQSVELDKINQEYNRLGDTIQRLEARLVEQSQAFNGNGNAVTNTLKRIEGLKDEQAELLVLLKEVSDFFVGGIATDTAEDPAQNQEVKASYEKRLEYIQQSLNLEGEILANANKKQFELAQQGANEQLALLEERFANERARKDFERQRELEGFAAQREDILANESITRADKASLVAELDQLEKQAKEQHQNDLTNIEARAAQARQRIAEQEGRGKLAVASGIFGNLSSLMNTESRKLFEIGKAASIANAIVEGIEAVQSSYRFGARIGGPPLGAAFAASAAVATLANVRAIQSTQYGSRGTGQSYQGGQVVNNAGNQQQGGSTTRNVNISIAGDSFSAGSIRALISELNEAAGDGVNIGFGG
jgi:quinol monooxygenase YgiN